MDSFTETTSEGWRSRIRGSIKGILIGIVLLVVSFPVLFFNEGRAIKTQKGYEEAGGAVVSVSADKVDPANDGKLVHLTAEATTTETLTDSKFGIAVENVISLKRSAEMYQWDEDIKTESKKKPGGSKETKKTYTYDKEWSSSLINSADFKKTAGHENPSSMPVKGDSQTAGTVTVGAFKLASGLVSQIDKDETVNVSDKDLAAVKADFKNLKVSGGKFYLGETPGTPDVGDCRVGFKAIRPQIVSLMAIQKNGSFEQYVTSTNTKIFDLREGTISAADMVAKGLEENVMMTWILRGVGFLLMGFGIGMILNPLSVIADVVPFIGSLVGGATALIAIVAAAGMSLVTIAIGWVFYRPLVGIPLLLLGIGGIVAIVMMNKKKEA